MEQKTLRDELAAGVLGNLYLLYGEERFLVGHFAKTIEQAIKKSTHSDDEFYKDVFDGKEAARNVIAAADTLPFVPGRRLVLVRDSGLFAAGRKDDSDFTADYLDKIPSDTVLLFVESSVDKRLKIFKRVNEIGRVLECERQTPSDLIKWLTRELKQKNVKIRHDLANLILSVCGTDMVTLYQETDKLAHYCGAGNEVTEADIRTIMTPTLESKIFALTKAMGQGQVKEAVKMYNTMLFLKESPFGILAMIIRQLRIILLCKAGTEAGVPKAKIAKDLGLRDFAVNEGMEQARRFTTEKLMELLTDCRDTDYNIKMGLMTQEMGIELLLIKAATR